MVFIKTWKEYESFRKSERKLVIYVSDNKKKFIEMFSNENILFCDDKIEELFALCEPLDIIICPKNDSKNIVSITRCFINSKFEIYLYIGGNDELYHHNTLSLNDDIRRIYSEIKIPLYKYFQLIYYEQSMASGIIINYKKEYSLREFLGKYVNHLFGKRITCYQPEKYN